MSVYSEANGTPNPYVGCQVWRARVKVVCLGHWFNIFGLRVSFGDASSCRRRSALARRRLPFLLVDFVFPAALTLIRSALAAGKWANLRTILFILCFLLFDRQLIPINTDFWR